MNYDKLNEAAEKAYLDRGIWKYRTEMIETFKQGADWLMNQPLSERLTDEEKDRIREKFTYYTTPNAFLEYEPHEIVTACLEEIFGADLFRAK